MESGSGGKVLEIDMSPEYCRMPGLGTLLFDLLTQEEEMSRRANQASKI